MMEKKNNEQLPSTHLLTWLQDTTAPPYRELYQHLVIKQQVLLSRKPTTKLSPTSVGVEAVPVPDL